MGGHGGQRRLPGWDVDDGYRFVLCQIGRLALLYLAGLAISCLIGLLAAHPAAAQTAGPAADIFAPLAQPVGQTIDFMAWGGRIFGFLMLLFAGGRTAMKGQVDWPTILSATFGILLFLIAAPLSAWLSSMATPEPVSGGGGGSGQTVLWTCKLCSHVTVRLEDSLKDFRELAFTGLAAPSHGLARIGVVIFTFAWAWKLLGNPDEARNAIPRFIQQFLWSCLAFGLLANPSWVVSTLVKGVEGAFLSTAAYLLELAQSHFSTGTGVNLTTDFDNTSQYYYSKLWAQVEATVLPLIGIFFARLENVLDLGKAILAVILATPFVFVAGIFIAFLAQTLFYVAAVCAVSPLLIAGMMFGPIRSMLFASLRFAMGGGLTLIIAAIAMGVTGTLTMDIIKTAGNEALQESIASADDRPSGLDPTPDGVAMVRDLYNLFNGSLDASDPADVTANPFLSAEQAKAMLNPMRLSFYLALGAGAVSVILHLAAPRIASNIMGVTDSATSAGIVVAATQAAMTMVVGKAGQTAFGQQAPFHKPWWAGKGGGGGGDDDPAGGSGGSSFIDQFRAAAGAGLRGAGERIGGGGS